MEYIKYALAISTQSEFILPIVTRPVLEYGSILYYGAALTHLNHLD